MNDLQRKIFNKICDFVLCNSNLIKKKIPLNLTDREKLWNKLCPSIYVIGLEKNKKYFEEQSKFQGFERLVHNLYPKIMDSVKNELEDVGVIEDWFGEITELKNYFLFCFGCHLSHVLIAKDMIENNYDRVLVFEDDCRFFNYVSDDLIKELINLYEEKNDIIGFLNIGWGFDGENIFGNKNFQITKTQTFKTHSYIINRQTAKMLLDTIDTNKNVQTALYNMNKNSEQQYRCGADDFFNGFVENYTINKALTYQISAEEKNEINFNNLSI